MKQERVRWQTFAACRGADTNIFFPEPGDSILYPKTVCEGCPVKLTCLEVAMADPKTGGIWGGTSEKERRSLRRKRRAQKPEPDEAYPPTQGPAA